MAGESENAIASDFQKRGQYITRQAIAKRRKREGWHEEANPLILPAAGNPPSFDHLAGMKHWGKRSEENATKVVGWLQATGNLRLAAKSVGVEQAALSQWMSDDPQFAAEVERANIEFCLARIDEIVAAGRRGDWKASEKLLALHPLTREDFAAADSEGKGVTINLQFNVAREAVQADSQVVEVKAIDVG